LDSMSSKKIVKWMIDSELGSPVGIVDIAGVTILASLLGGSGIIVNKQGPLGDAIWNLRMTQPSFSHFFVLVLTFLISLYLSGYFYTDGS